MLTVERDPSSCFFDDWFFVVQIEPLEEHLVWGVVVAASLDPPCVKGADSREILALC